MDATTVDDLVARLQNSDSPTEPRRRREEADPAAAVPAGELIAALSAPGNETEPAAEGDSAPPTADGDSTQQPPAAGASADVVPPGDDADSNAASVRAHAPEAASEETQGNTEAEAPQPAQAEAAAPNPVSAAPSATEDAEGPDPEESPTPVPAADHGPTSVLGAAGATAAAAGSVTPGPDRDGPSTNPIPVVPAGADPSGAQWDSILQSLRRDLGSDTGATAAVSKGNGDAARTGGSGSGDHHRHRAWWAAGRTAVCMLAVLVLLFTGTEWVIKHRADNVLASNHVDAIVPDDTNISTPTVAGQAPSTAAGTSGGSATTAAAGGATTTANNVQHIYPAENILLMGSDSRFGAQNAKLGNAKVGTATTMQSDVLMIAHLSADRQHVTIVSIPRDLYVKAPTCKAWDYTTNTLTNQDYISPYTEWKITNAFSVGGPQCTVKAIQEFTGLKINRVIIIDFEGFKDMVDALGGITIDVCKPIVDGQLGTVIKTAGVQEINGTQALNLVRARKVVGDPSGDLGRIRRQQVVLSTLLRQVTKAGVLLNPARLDSLLQAFVKNTHSDNVSLDDLIQLAQSLGNLSPSKVTFYTVPTVASGDGLNATPVAYEVFNALVNDQPLPGEATSKPTPSAHSSTAGHSAAGAEPPLVITVAPRDVDVQLVNVTGRTGVATTTMTALDKVGFAITDADLILPQNQVQSEVTVLYDPSNRAAGLTVAAAVPGALLIPTPGLGKSVRLMLGSTFDGTVRAVAMGQSVAPSLLASGDSGGDGVVGVAATTTLQAPSRTLTTQQVSGVNASTVRCA
jgi:LCP family protein required for cell wall assembly